MVKVREIEMLNQQTEGKKVIQLGDFIIKNMERFSLNYSPCFPSSTVLNAGIGGDTAEALLHRIQDMKIPALLIILCFSVVPTTSQLSHLL